VTKESSISFSKKEEGECANAFRRKKGGEEEYVITEKKKKGENKENPFVSWRRMKEKISTRGKKEMTVFSGQKGGESKRFSHFSLSFADEGGRDKWGRSGHARNRKKGGGGGGSFPFFFWGRSSSGRGEISSGDTVEEKSGFLNRTREVSSTLTGIEKERGKKKKTLLRGKRYPSTQQRKGFPCQGKEGPFPLLRKKGGGGQCDHLRKASA